LDWQPQYTIEQGLQETIKAYQEFFQREAEGVR